MSRRAEPGDGAAFALEAWRVFELRPGDEVNYVGVGGTGDQRDVAALDTRRHHRFSPGAGELHRAAHDHRRDQRAAADVDGFDVQTVFRKETAVLTDQYWQVLKRRCHSVGDAQKF